MSLSERASIAKKIADFHNSCTDVFTACLNVEKKARTLMRHSLRGYLQSVEVRQNIMLAIRHLEDAQTRINKAIQHSLKGNHDYDR